MTLLESYNTPFAVAFVVVLLLALFQAIGLGDLFGGDAEADIGGDAKDGSALQAGALDGLFTLLGIGRVPFTVWLAVFLFAFAAIGVSTQALADSLTGAPLYPWLAALIAGGVALPVTGLLARPLGVIMPRDETSAVSTASLVGRRARISDGIARKGYPARARVVDVHGQAHHVMVEPHEESSELHAGDDVLLVRREGHQFYATALAERRLSPQG
jgi:hypothetical protein